MRRRKLLTAVVGLAVLVAVGAFVLWPRQDRVTRENYDQIKVGMTRAEVDAILGPPGDYTTVEPFGTGYGQQSEGTQLIIPPTVDWVGDEGYLQVGFDDEDRVVGKIFTRHLQSVRASLERIIWPVKRLWRRWFPE
jgi:hypothetical protein